jgi:predicted amidophosphoribosyltransferase
MMSNSVGDDAIKYMCYSCFAEIVFETCKECGFHQSIPARWYVAFTCGRCSAKVDIPRRRSYAASTKARVVRGYGYTYPKV